MARPWVPAESAHQRLTLSLVNAAMKVLVLNRLTIRHAPVLAIAGALLLAGCNSDKSTGPTATAVVRLVNASSATPSADAYVGTQILASTLLYRSAAASCVKVPAGAAQTLTFRQTGSSANVATLTQNFTADGNYTVVLYGSTAVRAAVALNDTRVAPTTGNAAIRFFNGTSSAGTVHATPTTTTTLSAATALAGADNIGPNSATSGGFLTVPTTNNRIRFMDVGVFTGTPRADINPITLPANNVTTVFFTDPGALGGATYFTAAPCA